MRFVGWVERSETHRLGEIVMLGVMGFAALYPSPTSCALLYFV